MEGPSAVDFDLTSDDIACKGGSGFINLSHIRGDYNSEFLMRISRKGEAGIKHSYTLSNIDYNFTLEFPRNPDNNPLLPGDYLVELVQRQNACPNIDISELIAAIGDTISSWPNHATGSASIVITPSGDGPYEARIKSLRSLFVHQDTINRGWVEAIVDTYDRRYYGIEFKDLYAGTYMVEVKDGNGCLIPLEVVVDYNKTIFIPNIFTPNADNHNDIFYIRNLPDSDARLLVTNRWGAKVFETESYQNNWTGGSLADGIYYYRLVVGQETYTGWVEIWRGANP